MPNPYKIALRVLADLDWTELVLLILNVGIGVAIVYHLGYMIDWITVIYLSLWVTFFYLGNAYLIDLINHQIQVGDSPDAGIKIKIDQLCFVLFLSLSIIPLIQTLMKAENQYFAAYLICGLGFWMLMMAYQSKKESVIGIRESISSFAISFVMPLIVLNIHGIQIHKVLMPVSLFTFFQIIAFYFIQELLKYPIREELTDNFYAHIGYPTLNKLISILIPLGYITCSLLLLGQNRIVLLRRLVLMLPFGIFLMIVFNKSPLSPQYRSLNWVSRIFIIFAEISWIIAMVN